MGPRPPGPPDRAGAAAAPLRRRQPEQYTSIRYTERLAEIGAAPSIGSVGDPIDNAVAESTIGLFKTELIRRQGPWRGLDDVELATLGYVDWFNHRRLHSEIGDVPPAQLEATHYRSRAAPITA